MCNKGVHLLVIRISVHAGFLWPLPSRVRMELQCHPNSAWKRST